MAEGSSATEDILPPRPIAPQPSDCCGTGCCPCVHDLYHDDLVQWKKQCAIIKHQALYGSLPKTDSDEVPAIILPTQYKPFKIIEVTEVSTNCYLYTFLIETACSLPMKIGQHIIAKQTCDDGTVVTRQYTPVSGMDQMGKFDVLIKLYDKGKMTQRVKMWKVTDEIPWRGPFGSFTYDRNSYKRIVVLGAGTGIAPLYQIIRHVVSDAAEETLLALLYASKTFSDILLRGELLELTSNWNFTMKHFLSREVDASLRKYREQVSLGRLTKGDVKMCINEGPIAATLVLICGTKSFVKDMINSTKDLELKDEDVFTF